MQNRVKLVSQQKIYQISSAVLVGLLFFAIIIFPQQLFCENTYKVKSIKTIKEYGKSLDWSAQNNLILSETRGTDGYFDIFVMKPDGSGERNLTFGKAGCPQKHNGNSSWHPSGDYIVFTAEKNNNPVKYREWAIPGTGYNCDLWAMTSDGEKFYQLTNYPLKPPFKGVVHPEFSRDGNKIFWAERVEKGKSFGGGWVLKIADFIVGGNTVRLENTKTYKPGQQSCFYESHAFSNDSRKILFSGNLQSGQSHVGLDIYELDLETNQLKRLTNTPNDWDEHAHYSPDGTKIAWMSSTGFDIAWGKDISGHKWAKYLITELWMMDADGFSKQRLTYFNTPGHPEYIGRRSVVSDSSWSPDGKSIVALVAYETPNGKLKAKVVVIEFE